MTKKLIYLITFHLIVAMIFTSTVIADTKSVKLKLSHTGPGNTMGNAMQACAEAFKYVLENRSGGRFEVEIYPMGTLGSETDQMEAVKNGVTQMFFASMPAIARVYSPGLIGFSPYLFKNEDVAMKVFEGPFGQKLLNEISKATGTKGFDYIAGYNYLAITNNKRPIKSPEDLRGLKFRVMDPMGTAMFNSLGASAVPIAFAEVFTSLQTGVVDGQTNPPFIVESAKLYEVQKYMTMARSQWGYQFVLVNDKWFDDLSDHDKKLLRNSFKAAKQTLVGMTLILEKMSVDRLAKKGMNINVLPPEMVDEFAKIARPAGLTFMREIAGDAFVDEMLNEINRVEKELGMLSNNLD